MNKLLCGCCAYVEILRRDECSSYDAFFLKCTENHKIIDEDGFYGCDNFELDL